MPITEIFDSPWRNVLEISIISSMVYAVYLLLRVTQGVRHLALMVFALLGLAILAQQLDLAVLRLFVNSFFEFALIVILIIFAPELRRAVAEVNRYQIFSLNSAHVEALDELCEAVEELSRRHFGALIAIRRQENLAEVVDKGVKLNAETSKELLLTIFYPKSALHDGGVILGSDRTIAAACVFPVTQREMKDRSIGLRHRAALGLSEETDAIVIVVSEETGQISIAQDGTMERDLDGKELRSILRSIYNTSENSNSEDAV